jgi:hypothetical protein
MSPSALFLSRGEFHSFLIKKKIKHTREVINRKLFKGAVESWASNRELRIKVIILNSGFNSTTVCVIDLGVES